MDDDVAANKMEEGGVSEMDYKNAREYVLSTYSNVKEYEFDKENELWCKLTFDVRNVLGIDVVSIFLKKDFVICRCQ